MKRQKEQALIPNYDKKLIYYSPATLPEMTKIMDLVGVKRGGFFLDVGCGDGRAAAWAVGMDYLGVDYSTKRIEHAIKKQPTYCQFVAADLYTYLPTLEPGYDIIWCCELLEHLEEPRLIWEEMKRLVSPTGKVVCTCPVNMPHPNHLQVFKTPDELMKIFPDLVDLCHVRCRNLGGKLKGHFVFTYAR